MRLAILRCLLAAAIPASIYAIPIGNDLPEIRSTSSDGIMYYEYVEMDKRDLDDLEKRTRIYCRPFCEMEPFMCLKLGCGNSDLGIGAEYLEDKRDLEGLEKRTRIYCRPLCEVAPFVCIRVGCVNSDLGIGVEYVEDKRDLDGLDKRDLDGLEKRTRIYCRPYCDMDPFMCIKIGCTNSDLGIGVEYVED